MFEKRKQSENNFVNEIENRKSKPKMISQIKQAFCFVDTDVIFFIFA